MLRNRCVFLSHINYILRYLSVSPILMSSNLFLAAGITFCSSFLFVTVVKYPSKKKTTGEGVYFRSQFQLRIHYYKEIRTAGASNAFSHFKSLSGANRNKFMHATCLLVCAQLDFFHSNALCGSASSSSFFAAQVHEGEGNRSREQGSIWLWVQKDNALVNRHW